MRFSNPNFNSTNVSLSELTMEELYYLNKGYASKHGYCLIEVAKTVRDRALVICNLTNCY